jgi:hypothetical protein
MYSAICAVCSAKSPEAASPEEVLSVATGAGFSVANVSGAPQYRCPEHPGTPWEGPVIEEPPLLGVDVFPFRRPTFDL